MGLAQRLKAAVSARRASAPDYRDLDSSFLELHDRCRPYTMTSTERMYALWGAARHVCRQGIAGDALECGVWQGGSSMLVALTFDREGDHERRVWLYDTFEGMSEPTERDVAIDGFDAAEHWNEIRSQPDGHIVARTSLDDVRANMATTGLPAERFNFVKGPVEQTIPGTLPERIALLRLDTDWYESTRHELDHLWERLEPGGVLIIDDYGHWVGAREAVDEFFADRADAPLLVRIDYTGRLGVKR